MLLLLLQTCSFPNKIKRLVKQRYSGPCEKLCCSFETAAVTFVGVLLSRHLDANARTLLSMDKASTKNLSNVLRWQFTLLSRALIHAPLLGIVQYALLFLEDIQLLGFIVNLRTYQTFHVPQVVGAAFGPVYRWGLVSPGTFLVLTSTVLALNLMTLAAAYILSLASVYPSSHIRKVPCFSKLSQSTSTSTLPCSQNSYICRL